LFSSALAWSADLKKVGVYYDLERPAGDLTHFYLFEIYSMQLTPKLKEKFEHASHRRVIPTENPKLGFLKMGEAELPHKVYLVKPSEIALGQVYGTTFLGTNVKGLIESDFEGHNHRVLEALNLLEPEHRIRFLAAALVRIQMPDGSLVLIPNKGTWNNGRHQYGKGSVSPAAIGGVTEANFEKLCNLSGTHSGFVKDSGLEFERKVVQGQVDVNLKINAGSALELLKWYESTLDRELDPSRELREELVVENAIFSAEDWTAWRQSNSCNALSSVK
jgi:hypothetical protein